MSVFGDAELMAGIRAALLIAAGVALAGIVPLAGSRRAASA